MTTATVPTVSELFAGTVAEYEYEPALRTLDDAVSWTWGEYGRQATAAAAASLIGNVCAIGDARPFNVALVTLDAEAAATVDDPQAEVQAQIARANERLARVEQIKRFAVLSDDWLADGDELTPTSKLKRRAIAAKYATEIEGMYAGS